jgi:hypothetical protein
MGIGDYIMATGDARKIHAEHGVRCVFGNGKHHWWSDAFENNPKITRPSRLLPDEKYAWIANFPGSRPYVLRKEGYRLIYDRAYKAVPGELFLTDAEKELAIPGAIIIEPNVKTKYHGPIQLDIGRNKDWGWKNWEEIAKIPLPWIQLGDEVRDIGVRRIRTRNIREAFGLLSQARLVVTTDGALHHAAAVLGIPAIVLWGGMASPENLGYDFQTNIWNGQEPCGTVIGRCEHCRGAMASISVKQVVEAIERELEKDKWHLAPGRRDASTPVRDASELVLPVPQADRGYQVCEER